MTDISSEPTTSTSPSIIVYWLNESRADRILLLLEELELPYVIEKFDRGLDKLAPAELKKIHPLGKSPMIKDGDKVVAESGFIIDYLISKYGKGKNLKPTNEDDLFQYNYVCHLFIVGHLSRIVLLVLALHRRQSDAHLGDEVCLSQSAKASALDSEARRQWYMQQD